MHGFDRLKLFINKVEALDIEEDTKLTLYAIISDALHKTVYPIIVAHMDKVQMDRLLEQEENIKINDYLDLIANSINNPDTLMDVDTFIITLCERVEAELLKHGVAFT